MFGAAGRGDSFQAWLEQESIAHRTAYRAIAVWEVFDAEREVIENFEVEALYLLSKKSTPSRARTKAIALAKDGERVSASRARSIVRRIPDKTKNKQDDITHDPHGEVIPEELRYLFVDSPHAGLLVSVGGLQQRISSLSEAESAWMPHEKIQGELQQLSQSIQDGQPYCICPRCKGIDWDQCEECQRSGYMTESAFQTYQGRGGLGED